MNVAKYINVCTTYLILNVCTTYLIIFTFMNVNIYMFAQHT